MISSTFKGEFSINQQLEIMKATYKLTMVLLATFLLSLGSCNEDSSCKDDDYATSYSVNFNLSVKVVNKDGTPYIGMVYYSINKEYCDEETKGYYTNQGTTSSTGYWSPNYIMNYTFTNPKDKVSVKWSVNDHSSLYHEFDVGQTQGETIITKTFDYTLN